MSDKLCIDGLIVHAYHGVMRHEPKIGQTFQLDVVVKFHRALDHDGLCGVSHQAVAQIAQDVFCARQYHLIEAAAGAVVDALLDSSLQITAVRVVVHQPHAPIAATFADIGVTIERDREAHGVEYLRGDLRLSSSIKR